MDKLYESDIEALAITCLKKQGYQYRYAPDISYESDTPERTGYSDTILNKRLYDAVARINPTVSADVIKDAIKQIERTNTTDLINNNETFHRMLTEGIKVNYQQAGHARGDIVWLIDFESPENNDYLVVNQFTVTENNNTKRPDIIVLVNGLPLIVIELKNPVDDSATIHSAFQQLQTYKQAIPTLFTYNGFMIISDGLEAKAGTISSSYNRFMAWKTANGKKEASPLIGQLETLITGMMDKATLLDLLRHFIVFEKIKKEDSNTGIISIETVKKLASYHQYYAVNKAIESTLRASGYANREKTEHNKLAIADRKGGVVWHTQGSGKSLSMVFYTGKIILAMHNPTILVITDRNDLDDQLFDTFAASKQLLRQAPVQVNTREELKERLKVASGGVVFATIQKFQPEEGNIYETLSHRENIIVIADEAHRTQYGFKPKTLDEKDKAGNVVGKKLVYGFAKYMRDALPNATYLGFTGTPIEKSDVNTPLVFGDYVDVYDISQSIKDGATVRIYYESRLAKINLDEKGKKLISEFDNELELSELTEAQKTKTKWTQLEALIGSKKRIKQVAADIVSHFEQRQAIIDGKGMIVAMSRRIAIELYHEITALKPEWHNNDLGKGAIKVVMTSSSSDGPTIAKHHTTKKQRHTLAARMRDPNDELKLVIVRDMWLTGFDAPCLHTLYIDKPMRGHNLMQAIARVNRVYKDKKGGLIVDYLGIASDLKKALAFYADSGGKGDPAVAQEQAVQLMLEKIEVVSQILHNFHYENFYNSDTSKKLSLILSAEDYILGLEDGKKRFINAVTALSQAFSIAMPHEQAMDVKDEIAFFQAVKARLTKFDHSNTGKTDETIESAIKQVIDKALVSEQVIDIFDAAGIKKPDISILSDEFLLEVKNMQHKNLAMEVLKKLLNDEIKTRTRTNLVQSRTLMEMLETSIKKYHSKILTAAEFINELISLGKDIQSMDDEPKKLGLSDFEYAFYMAIADNKSANELMQKDKLRELAVVLFEKVKANTSIDWTIKENVKAKLKVVIKRTLRQYGYPPDMQKLATENVLKQAEMIAADITDI